MAKTYDAKDVRVLNEVEHIRLNPSMYIGDTSNPAHLIEEALDNALDEALAGYASIIAVNIDIPNATFAVIDNGRGIPIENDTPITVSSKLFSGAKFQDKKTAYEISSGLHGVGLVAVNALSEFYNVEIYRNGQYATCHFKDTKLVRKKITKSSGDRPFATKIEFKPSKKIFETLVPDIDRIRRRLTTASAQMPKVKFVLNVENGDYHKEVINLSLGEHFKENCLTTDEETVIFNLKAEKKPEDFSVMFTFEENGPNTPKVFSSINLLPVGGGGTHVNAFHDVLKDFFAAKAKKFGYKFRPNDCLVGLRAYLMLNLKEPKFAGQTKERLTNRKTYFDKFIKVFRNQLDSIYEHHTEVIDEYLKRFDNYRKKLDSKNLTKDGTKGKRLSTQFTKLRDCTNRSGELFIVEGDSAGGSIIQSRDPKIHAILPLKGKSIPNVVSKKDILKNKEVGELVRAIGTGIGPHFDIRKLRYSKIVCTTDADYDGAHIACLLTMVIAVLLPDLIKEGHYYIAQTPLFAINEGKKFIPLWNEKELQQARKNKRTISRFKGLGELTPAQMKICLLNEKTRNLIPVSYTTDIDHISKLFSDVEAKRTLLEDNFETNHKTQHGKHKTGKNS
jgi:DNA gyrase/topoisomerase IV subunit B